MSEVRRMNLRSVGNVEASYYGDYTIRVTITDADKGEVQLHVEPYMAVAIVERIRDAILAVQKDVNRLVDRVGGGSDI